MKQLKIISKDDPRTYRRNRGGLTVMVKGKPILHLNDIEYVNDAMVILRSYRLLMYYLKQRKGAKFSNIPNNEIFEKFHFTEPFALASRI